MAAWDRQEILNKHNKLKTMKVLNFAIFVSIIALFIDNAHSYNSQPYTPEKSIPTKLSENGEKSQAEYLQSLLTKSPVVKAFNVLSAYALESGGLQGTLITIQTICQSTFPSTFLSKDRPFIILKIAHLIKTLIIS